MRILCHVCGNGQEVVQVSNDYRDDDHLRFVSEAQSIRFVYDGGIVDAFLVSPSFCERYDLREGDLPLPEDYPKWTSDVNVLCKRCFEQRTTETKSKQAGGGDGEKPAS